MPRTQRFTSRFAGSRASSRIVSEMIKSRLNGDLLHVPYKSSGQALTDLMGGQVDFMSVDPTTALPLVRGDKLRALAVTSLRREALLPGIPTLSESGLKDFELVAWAAVFAPAGTHVPVHPAPGRNDRRAPPTGPRGNPARHRT